ncbi:MAG: NADP-dependent phosphogluconate dehydrogenase [Desulfobaccales bacterium]
MPKQGCEIGILGLGTMGRNLVLNLADRGFAVAVYNRTAEKTREFMAREVGSRDIRPAYELKEFAGLLRQPRALITMISAGEPVDIVIRELLPVLAPGDLLIDGGNSHFTDTNRRSRFLGAKGILFMGLGISGGEAGARSGPSLMPGGPRDAYARVEPVLEAAAARVNGEPCVAYLGEGSAGHYVKMVHNGIEYGLMELLAESYDLMKRGLGLGPEELHDIYAAWNEEELNSFLVEITARIFLKKDGQTGKPLIDLIRDEAKQKGTGMWTSWEAMDLQVATPNIDIAVVMRDLSGYRKQRMAMAQAMAGPKPAFSGDRGRFVAKLKNGLYAGMIVVYAQGLALLKRASRMYAYGLELETVARIWRGGCIIRAALLEDIRAAFQERADLDNLLLDPRLGKQFLARQWDLREIVGAAADLGLPAPGLMMSLAYFDAFRSARLPANLTQAQRDYFGAHTFEKLDAPGTFHADWDQD